MAFLKEEYNKKIAPELMTKFNYKSNMEIPKLEKIVINMGVGDAVHDSKNLELALNELELITGQKPIVTTAKKSIATFKLRAGQGIGAKVTLRGDNMWSFVETLFNVALPRVRDFRGLPTTSFDGRGNYTMGIKEQIIFPQIIYDNVKRVRGFDVSFITTTNSNEEAYALLKALGAPFKKLKGEK